MNPLCPLPPPVAGLAPPLRACDPWLVVSADARRAALSEAAVRLLELPDAHAELPATIQTVLGQADGDFVLSLDGADGARFLSVALGPDPDARLGAGTRLAVLHDASGLIRLQRALADSEGRLQAILGAAMDAIIAMDEAGRITLWNAAAERLFGWRADEVRGRDLHETLAGTAERARFLAHAGRWTRGGTSPVFGQILRLPAHRRDGTALDIELSLGAFRRHGHWQALGIVRDVSARVAAELELQVTGTRLQQALEGGNITYWDWDVSTGSLVLGPRYFSMLGYPDDAFPHTAESFRQLVHPDDRPQVEAALKAVLTGQTAEFACDFRLRAADGTDRWATGQGKVTARDAAGRPLRVIGTHRDIHAFHESEAALQRQLAETLRLHRELEEAQVQLVQSEKMAAIGQLAAGVAHEMNTPLGFVKSNVGTLQTYISPLLEVITALMAATDGFPGGAALADARARAAALDLDFLRQDLPDLFAETRDGIVRVQRIVADLKDFSHVDSATWAHADLHRGLDSTLNILHNDIKHRIQVIRDYGDLPLLWCRPSQLNQVFLNLLANAAQAIADRGTITVRTRADARHVTVDIADTGCGIAPEHLPRIFDAFFTTKPVGKGTGLGLSISGDIVRKHGGHLEVSSRPGLGSTFRIVLPVQVPDAPPPEKVFPP